MAAGGQELGAYYFTLSTEGVAEFHRALDDGKTKVEGLDDTALDLGRRFREAFEQGSGGAEKTAKALDDAGSKVYRLKDTTASLGQSMAQAFAAANAELSRLTAADARLDAMLGGQRQSGAGAADAVKSVGSEAKKTSSALGGLKSLGSSVAAAFKLGSASILGWVSAGLVGTVEGNRLALSIQMLAREITGVALPAVEWLTARVTDAVKWFRGLSGGQQDLILKLGATVAAVGLAGKALSVLWANPMVAGLLAVAAAIGYIGAQLVKVQGLADKAAAAIERINKGGATNNEKYLAAASAGITGKETAGEQATKAESQIAANQKRINEIKNRGGLGRALGPLTGSLENDKKEADRLRKENAALEKIAEDGRRGKAVRSQAEGGAGGVDRAEEEDKKHRGVHLAGGTFRGLGESYKAIQSAISQTAVSPDLKEAQKQTAELQQLGIKIDALKTAINLKPPVVRM